MTPKPEYITIDNNLVLIENFINDLIITPRKNLRKWSEITNQTPATKIGYIGQHLASLITGVKGTRSGARGNDLADGTEVKSCNKVDQVDKCNNCGNRVPRYEQCCPNCGSKDITRKNDSKWLISIRSEEELEQYLDMDRILFILMDYPDFVKKSFNDIRISAFEIYPKEDRCSCFCDLIKNHYYNIYLPKLNQRKKTNPMDFHPWSFQFYKCNPVETFECIVQSVDTCPHTIINSDRYIQPGADRSNIASIPMPSKLIKATEWDAMINSCNFEQELRPELKDDYKTITYEELSKMSLLKKQKAMPLLSQKLRDLIPLRPIKSTTQKQPYQRM